MPGLQRLIKFARKSPREQLAAVNYRLVDWGWKLPHWGNDRSAYVVGLFGSGRGYVKALIQEHIGPRAKNFRDELRFHPGPTSMIYSGHGTLKYACRGQALPEETRRILQAVQSGIADLIFIYRHPLDSLLTNWVWWRTLNRDGTMIWITDAYPRTEELCADLEQNFLEFKAFADGDPSFFVTVGGPRFLSLAEFVEETELYIQASTLALRVEDFMLDPLKEFTKIVKLLGADVDLRAVQLTPPQSKPYRYLDVAEKVPRFKDFVNSLDAGTKERIDKMGYKRDPKIAIANVQS